MKASLEAIRNYRKQGMRVIKQVMIASQSVSGKYYLVMVYEDGTISCECEKGGIYQQDCGHKKRAREMLLNNEL